MAREELERVSEIATQTLAFNRQTNLRTQASVSEILESVLMLYQARLASSKILVERRYGRTAPLICNPGELRQVFVNLIGNAFDATRNGGHLIVRTRDAVEDDQQGIRVTVADTGRGISAGMRGHLFEAFQSTKGSQGTGLGLWISKRIIDKHKGRVRVWSCTKPSHSGTVFSIFIPRYAVDTEESSLPSVLEATGT
jgi:signal transduction histidine kinase